MIYLSDFHKWGLFGFRASVVNVLRLENTIFQCVSIQNVQKQQNVTAWHNHKSDHNSGIRQKLACPRIVLQSLSPSGVVELIFSGTRLIFLKLIYFFPHYHSEEIAPVTREKTPVNVNSSVKLTAQFYWIISPEPDYPVKFSVSGSSSSF